MSIEENVLGAFLLLKDVRLLSQEEFDDVKKVIENQQKELKEQKNEYIKKMERKIEKLVDELQIYKIYTKQEDLDSFDMFIKQNYVRKDKIIEKVKELEQQIAEFKEYVKDSKGQEKIYWRRELAELVGARNSLNGLLEEK